MTNYSQIVASTLSMNLEFPKLVKAGFTPLKVTTESASVFLSIDCFIWDVKLTVFADSTFILKVFLSSLCPFIMLGCVGIFWLVIWVIFKAAVFKKAINSNLTLIFFFYPTVTLMVLSIFDCKTVNGTQYLAWDYAIECWKGTHLVWVGITGIPMMLFWVLGMPIAGMFLLWWNRKHLKWTTTLSKYRILYIGLKDEYYYWEMVNTFWKIILLMLNVFIEASIYKALYCSGFLMLVFFIQVRAKPYRESFFNALE